MKHLTHILIASILSASVMSAQDTYYYYDGSQVPISVNETKMVAITAKGTPPRVPAAGLTFSTSIVDSLSVISVYNVGLTTNIATIKRQAAQLSPNMNLQPCYKTASGLELTPTGNIYVELMDASDLPLLYGVAAANNCQVVSRNNFMPLWYTLRLSESSGLSPVDVANDIYETGRFSSASPDFAYNPLEISYDPDVSQQWGLYNQEYEGLDISVSSAWGYATGRGIKIAIIDQGIELTHDDLAANILGTGYDAYTGTYPSNVYNSRNSTGHGTHCAGIAAAVRNNNIMIAGVAPDASLLSVSCNFNASNILEQLADGINWAWRNDADILSCSWGGIESDIIKRALDLALANGREGKGCIVVKSAGNTGDSITFPGNYRPEIITVANMTKNGTLSASSSHGDNMHIAAPGTNILSTMVNNTTAVKSGTSMACPHVAGVVALMLERNPALSITQVKQILAVNAKKIGNIPYNTTKVYGSWNEHYGYGLVDAYNSVKNTPRR